MSKSADSSQNIDQWSRRVAKTTSQSGSRVHQTANNHKQGHGKTSLQIQTNKQKSVIKKRKNKEKRKKPKFMKKTENVKKDKRNQTKQTSKLQTSKQRQPACRKGA